MRILLAGEITHGDADDRETRAIVSVESGPADELQRVEPP